MAFIWLLRAFHAPPDLAGQAHLFYCIIPTTKLSDKGIPEFFALPFRKVIHTQDDSPCYRVAMSSVPPLPRPDHRFEPMLTSNAVGLRHHLVILDQRRGEPGGSQSEHIGRAADLAVCSRECV